MSRKFINECIAIDTFAAGLHALVFGPVRAKDLALKYTSNVYKGKYVTSFRAGIAAHTGKKGNRKRHDKIRHDEIMESLEELDEEIDNTTKVR